MNKARFDATLIEGHKGVTAVLLPFDPEAVWKQKPVRLAGRRHGWLVKGTLQATKFSGYIGDRWGRFFITVDAALRNAAAVSVGDVVSLSIEPVHTAEAHALACEQSERTTQPGKARADAVDFSPGRSGRKVRLAKQKGSSAARISRR